MQKGVLEHRQLCDSVTRRSQLQHRPQLHPQLAPKPHHDYDFACMQTPQPAWISRSLQQLRLDPWFFLGLTISLIACVWPLWASALLPFMDLPQHLAVVRILHSYSDPAFAVDHFHAISFAGTQYLSYYLFTDLLTYVFPLEVANRLVLSLV